jgi:hypothetical protein
MASDAGAANCASAAACAATTMRQRLKMRACASASGSHGGGSGPRWMKMRVGAPAMSVIGFFAGHATLGHAVVAMLGERGVRWAAMTWRFEDVITGERLQSLAEVTVLTPSIYKFHRSLPGSGVADAVIFDGSHTRLMPKPETVARLRGRKSIFVYTHLVASFIEQVLPQLDHRFVLISHNSDEAVDARFLPALDDPRIVHWYAQNAVVEHPKLTPLPIGLANAMWPHGDTQGLAAVAAAVPAERKPVVYCNFDVRTNPAIRVPLRDKLARSDITWMAPLNPYRAYLADMAGCRWCVSPFGNGVDCHRTWEALYLGVVPIISRTQPTMVLHSGLPVILLDDLGAIDRALIGREQAALESRMLELEKLSMRYWYKCVAASIAQAGT